MPCWQHEAGLATLSNTWFLCDRCREAMGFARDVAVALELAVAPVDTLQEALAESPTKAGSASADPDSFPPSPPPGAQPERDPAVALTVSASSAEAPNVVYAASTPSNVPRYVYFRCRRGDEIYQEPAAEIVRNPEGGGPADQCDAPASGRGEPAAPGAPGYLLGVDHGDHT